MSGVSEKVKVSEATRQKMTQIRLLCEGVNYHGHRALDSPDMRNRER